MEIPILDEILFIVAIKPEIEKILSKTKYEILKNKKSMILYRCFLNRSSFLLLQTGVGQANAVIASTLVFTNFSIKKFFFIGLCGALDRNLRIGDIVLADRIIQYDSFQSLEGESIQLKPGIPSFMTDIHKKPYFTFDNPSIFSLLKDNNSFDAKVGTMLSGSEFICSNQRKKELKSKYHDALAVDMESSGIASVSEFFNINGNVIKVVSDGIDNKSEEILNEFRHNMSFSTEVVLNLFLEICKLINDGKILW